VAIVAVVAIALLGIAHAWGTPRTLDPPSVALRPVLVACVALLLTPWLVSRFLLRATNAELGLRFGERSAWRREVPIAILASIALAAVLARLPVVASTYRRFLMISPAAAIASVALFALYFLAFEFFFRGFLLFGLAKSLGRAAIVVQALPFALVHLPKGAFETLASLFGGIAFGAIAWRARSFVPAWLIHVTLATGVNVFVWIFSR